MYINRDLYIYFHIFLYVEVDCPLVLQVLITPWVGVKPKLTLRLPKFTSTFQYTSLPDTAFTATFNRAANAARLRMERASNKTNGINSNVYVKQLKTFRAQQLNTSIFLMTPKNLYGHDYFVLYNSKTIKQ